MLLKVANAYKNLLSLIDKNINNNQKEQASQPDFDSNQIQKDANYITNGRIDIFTHEKYEKLLTDAISGLSKLKDSVNNIFSSVEPIKVRQYSEMIDTAIKSLQRGLLQCQKDKKHQRKDALDFIDNRIEYVFIDHIKSQIISFFRSSYRAVKDSNNQPMKAAAYKAFDSAVDNYLSTFSIKRLFTDANGTPIKPGVKMTPEMYHIMEVTPKPTNNREQDKIIEEVELYPIYIPYWTVDGVDDKEEIARTLDGWMVAYKYGP